MLQAINRRGHVPTERELYWQLEREQMQPVQEAGTVQMETTVEMEATHVEGFVDGISKIKYEISKF